MNSALENYIKQARQVGKTDEIIRQELKTGGWTDIDISQALQEKIFMNGNQSLLPVQQSSLKTFKQNHPIFLVFAISFLLYLISSTLLGRIPGSSLFHMIIMWFVIPIYIVKTIYSSVVSNKVSNTVNQVAGNLPEDSIIINKRQAKLSLILLALELPLLGVSSYVYFSNGGSSYGDYGVLMFIFSVTVFVPNLIAFAVFGIGYLKNLFKNWKQLSKYNIASFILLCVQLYLYFKFLSYL